MLRFKSFGVSSKFDGPIDSLMFLFLDPWSVCGKHALSRKYLEILNFGYTLDPDWKFGYFESISLKRSTRPSFTYYSSFTSLTILLFLE